MSANLVINGGTETEQVTGHLRVRHHWSLENGLAVYKMVNNFVQKKLESHHSSPLTPFNDASY